LSSAELRFSVGKGGQPEEVEAKAKVPMMDVVAEMMIAANSAVAERIATAFPGAALLRNHPPPRQEGLQEVRLHNPHHLPSTPVALAV
jgi:DIS3-like exonuclease 1